MDENKNGNFNDNIESEVAEAGSIESITPGETDNDNCPKKNEDDVPEKSTAQAETEQSEGVQDKREASDVMKLPDDIRKVTEDNEAPQTQQETPKIKEEHLHGAQSGADFYGASQATDVGTGKPKKKKNILKSILITAAIFVVVCFVALFLSVIRGGNNEAGIGGVDVGNSSYIATIYVEGTIQEGNVDYFGQGTGYQHRWTLDVIDDLMYDYNNCGLIIFVNSPGGGVYESDELYFKIKEYQEYTGNPVYAVMGGTAASGGYYISAPCDRIYANRNTWTGSIGVTIGTLIDVSGFLEQHGITTTTITSGANKAMGSSYQPMSDEEKAIWQALVDEAYDQFVGIVAEGRDLDPEYVYEIADGRILSAYQAIELDLVDEIGSVDDAYFAMMEELDDYSPELIDVIYESERISLSTLLSGIAAASADIAAADDDVDSVLEIVNSINTTPISYYCEILAQ